MTQDVRPAIRSTRTASGNSRPEIARKESYGYEERPSAQRASTFQGPTQIRRDISPIEAQRMTRVPSDTIAANVKAQRAQLKPTTRGRQESPFFTEPSDESTVYSSPERSYNERSASPATSYGSGPSRTPSYSGLDGMGNGKKMPPPPPPSRAKKPPPPPPPAKRSGLSSTALTYA